MGLGLMIAGAGRDPLERRWERMPFAGIPPLIHDMITSISETLLNDSMPSSGRQDPGPGILTRPAWNGLSTPTAAAMSSEVQ